MIEKLCIIGVGLIGGSLARALKEKGYCKQIVGSSRSADHLQKAVDLGVIDSYSTDMQEAVKGADVIIVCVPLGAMEMVFSKIKDVITPDTIITDVGSSKQSVVDAAERAFGEIPASLIPGHPIAGTEKSGVEASFAELYQRRKVILTPLENNNPEQVEKIENMWLQTGAEVRHMSVQHHDEVLAATSHLPHVLAFGIVDTLAKMDSQQEIFEYAAGGFRDFTRIASSDPVMWRDICVNNRDALLKVMRNYIEDMELLYSLIEQSDGEALSELFEGAKGIRDKFNDMLQG
ncbi:MAG: prephenate dehydrogenase/arogenate dehydrogenase family protein [Gammaproteobacteria bacterium]|nr:MAG: prephenate dehydrogenase/arogenate dehydrogenase family protein [Gammaproteobacteria bacterium]